EGFLKTGDAMRFVDPAIPEHGLRFDGRLGEDFKLSTGTWVHVGALRLKAIGALEPLAQDVVVTGHDRDEVGFLVVPHLAACRRWCGLSDAADAREITAHVAFRSHVAAALRALATAAGGSSTHAARALVMLEPLSIDAGEITDKGYVNQRAVLARRAALVERLYRTPFDTSIITPFDARESASTGGS
ncbi:MAG TPA: hypothetical protein VGQ57_01310, partial [Polyangiaceae bacterium]|nr:hypothetical protein [Polyangiaceae bacterium]